MLEQVNLQRTLYADIETAACAKDFNSMSEPLKKQWAEKFQLRLKDGETLESKFDEEAGLHSAFGKVITVVFGKLVLDKPPLGAPTPPDAGVFKLELQTHAQQDEATLLKSVSDYLCGLPADVRIAGHNLKNFDAPYLCRRMLVNGIQIPPKLWALDKKPWESQLLDTMEIWRFGEHQQYIKLELLAHLLGIKSSKDDISGPDVSKAYWSGELERIVKYCQKDVVVLANIMLRMKGQPVLLPENVRVNNKEEV